MACNHVYWDPQHEKAIGRERVMLSKLMQKSFGKNERRGLFQQWAYLPLEFRSAGGNAAGQTAGGA
ncbi:hypothetical protein DVH24_002384 [Malus domestica]|uniref:Uncharacterized protein n=1 Tax=Malus domestica TaxID=3750 RepID=A0A498KPK5_MALDO|nr:hypothetical protein DVH24_002384 [Malus domestica]